MQPSSDYAKIITAAHRGSKVAQEALAVIEDVRFMLLHSCDENHIIPPRDLEKNQVSDAVAHGLIERSPWLKGAVQKYAEANGSMQH